MMQRTQITLDPQLHSRARERARQLGVSLAEYVRGLLLRDLSGQRPTSDASCVFNLGDSGGSNVARDKDAMVGEAVAAAEKHHRSATS
jgi:hypothetical protein